MNDMQRRAIAYSLATVLIALLVGAVGTVALGLIPALVFPVIALADRLPNWDEELAHLLNGAN